MSTARCVWFALAVALTGCPDPTIDPGSDGGTGGAGGTGGGTGGSAAAPAFGTFVHFQSSPTPGNAGVADFAVDAAGVRHVVFTESGGTPNVVVYYGRCAANCGLESSWSFARPGPVGATGQLPTMAVEPDGTVHLMVMDASVTPWRWVYARCASNCAVEASWTNSPLPSLFVAGLTNMNIIPGWGRSLAANGGRLALVVAAERFGTVDPRRGTYVATCTGTCTADASWRFTSVGPLGTESELHSIAMTATGGVRLAYATLPSQAEVHYAECDASCGLSASWRDVGLTRGAGAVGLVLDAQGRPRLTWFGGDDGSWTAPFGGLGYGACDANCSSFASWGLVVVKTGYNGTEGADVALTAAGTPVLAYQTDGTQLAIATCTSNCAAVGSSWQTTVLEDPATLASDLPPLQPTCPAPTASNPNTPRVSWRPGALVSLGRSGDRAVMTHIAQVLQQCGTSTPVRGPRLVRFNDAPLP